MQHVEITTFGYLHSAPPSAHITIDLRTHFRDPHVSPEMRYMTANDPEVRAAVMNTPGVRDVVSGTTAAVLGYLSGPSAGPVSVAVGCAGGRHRAATVGMELEHALTERGVPVSLVHRDLRKGVVAR